MDFVSILITSSINTFGTERRFPRDIILGDLKGKLELLTGASCSQMQLELRNKDDNFVAKLDNDNATLDSYQVENGMKIHVIDTGHLLHEFEDITKVAKFELPDEEYASRNESLRAFKMKNKLGQFNTERSEEIQLQKQQKDAEEEALANTISIDSRCEVKIAGQSARRGTVMFVGKTDFKPGFWVGVRYDEPLGKNDGSVKGKKYFDCQPNYGSFVKPQDVTVGDFPEEFNIDEEL